MVAGVEVIVFIAFPPCYVKPPWNWFPLNIYTACQHYHKGIYACEFASKMRQQVSESVGVYACKEAVPQVCEAQSHCKRLILSMLTCTISAWGYAGLSKCVHAGGINYWPQSCCKRLRDYCWHCESESVNLLSSFISNIWPLSAQPHGQHTSNKAPCCVALIKDVC